MQNKLKLFTFFAAFFVLCIFTAKYFFTNIENNVFYQNYQQEYQNTSSDETTEPNQEYNTPAIHKTTPINYAELEIFDYKTPPRDVDIKALKRKSTKKLSYTNYEDRVRMEAPEDLDSNGLYVALMQAVADNDIKRAKTLIARGARLNSPDGDTSFAPIFWAISNGNVEIIDLLIKSGAKLNTPDENGVFPIHWVVESSANRPYAYHTKEIFDLLLDAHPTEINRQDKNLQRTPLMLAVAINNHKAFSYLLDKGANVTIINKEKKDVTDIALENSCHACVQLIETKRKQNETTPLLNFASTFTAPDPIWLPYSTTKKTTTKKKVVRDPNMIVIQGDSMSLPVYKEMPQILPLKKETGPNMVIREK